MSVPLPMAEELRRLLYASVVSDVLDGIGLMHQALRPFVRPLDERLTLFGPARTGRYERATMPSPDHNPYALEMDLIDSLLPGEVVVLACDGPTEVIAPWGELLSTAARARRAAGCVTDGLVRDVTRIRAMEFPVFHGGIGPLDTRNRAEMMAKDVTVMVAGVAISPGDWILGDVDGVVVIPADEAELVIRAALEKISAEDTTRAELEAGRVVARGLRSSWGAVTSRNDPPPDKIEFRTASPAGVKKILAGYWPNPKLPHKIRDEAPRIG